MTHEVADKVYAGLAGEQRFRAMISAASRNDTYEMDRLADTCPRYTYREMDADFKVPAQKFALMAQAHATQVLRLMVAFLMGVELCRVAEERETDAPGAEQLQDMGFGGLFAKMRAWDRFCEGIGLSPKEVAKGCGIADDGPEGLALGVMKNLEGQWEFDEEQTEQFAGMEASYLKHLNETWAHANRPLQ